MTRSKELIVQKKYEINTKQKSIHSANEKSPAARNNPTRQVTSPWVNTVRATRDYHVTKRR